MSRNIYLSSYVLSHRGFGGRIGAHPVGYFKILHFGRHQSSWGSETVEACLVFWPKLVGLLAVAGKDTDGVPDGAFLR